MLLIAACVADPSCALEGAGGERSGGALESTRDLLGLKCGLAAAFVGMTVLASFLPYVFRTARSFKACPAPFAAPSARALTPSTAPSTASTAAWYPALPPPSLREHLLRAHGINRVLSRPDTQPLTSH